jgi:peptide/nickel transport system substrate-binding protein
MPGFDADSVIGYPYDPEAAAVLLKAAGYPGGKGLPVISLKSNPTYNTVMEFVQKGWERIGVTCEIDNMDGATLRELASKGEINLWRASWIADYPDAENYLSLLYSPNMPPNGPNRMRYQNATYDSLFDQSLSAPNDTVRFSMFHQMENLMLDAVPVIPLYYDQITRMTQQNITGLEPNAMNFLDLRKVKKH